MRRREPTRIDNTISQQFNDGVVTILRTQDAAKPGYQPQRQTKELFRLRYANRRLGINRIYLARQQQVQIAQVIRVPRAAVCAGDLARLENGACYAVDTVQEAVGVYPACLDLSLREIETKEAAEHAMV